MKEIAEDSRFYHILEDAKFKKLPKENVKVKIDKRFQSMFHEKNFHIRNKVDKRGRAATVRGSEDLKKYYKVSDGESVDDNDQNENHEPENSLRVDKEDHQFLTPDIKKKLKDLTIDYARGEGCIYSDSSSDDESTSSDDSNELEFDHDWGELDKDADKTDTTTSRLAVCNLNWDRIEATDLMVLFTSFLPPKGVIHSITIYPSEFGLERMKEEEENGPTELLEPVPEGEKELVSQIQMEKLRKYELNRLRYYYAVIVCDSADTANILYTECDGLDYECSSTKLDLRFIPDDTTFDQEPKETCTTMPEMGVYRPKYFVTSALTKAKVDLTWDETDMNRQEMVRSIHNGHINENNLRKYLACSSSEDENECEKEDINENKIGDKTGYIEKYKNLLADIESNEKKNERNKIDMEVTWNLEIENKASESIKETKKDKEIKTPFQKYLDKRKEKKKKKKSEKIAQSNKMEPESNDSAFSDDEIPSDIDLNDPYFKEEFKGCKSKNKKSKKNKLVDIEQNNEHEKEKAELELLMLDSESQEKKHFNLKKIENNEKLAGKKLKKAMKRKADDSDALIDSFDIDVNDERFSALYTSHHFNIDPADPQFKATKGTKKLIEEKLKRREREERLNLKSSQFKRKIKEPTEYNENLNLKSKELTRLIKNIKQNTTDAKVLK